MIGACRIRDFEWEKGEIGERKERKDGGERSMIMQGREGCGFRDFEEPERCLPPVSAWRLNEANLARSRRLGFLALVYLRSL